MAIGVECATRSDQEIESVVGAADCRFDEDRALAQMDRIAVDPVGVRTSASRAARRLPNVREQFEGQVALYTELLQRRGKSE